MKARKDGGGNASAMHKRLAAHTCILNNSVQTTSANPEYIGKLHENVLRISTHPPVYQGKNK